MNPISLNAQSDYFSFLPIETREAVYSHWNVHTLNCFARTCKEFRLMQITLQKLQDLFALKCPTDDQKHVLRRLPLEKYSLLKTHEEKLKSLHQWDKISISFAAFNTQTIELFLKTYTDFQKLFLDDTNPEKLMRLLQKLDEDKLRVILDHAEEFKRCYEHARVSHFDLDFIENGDLTVIAVCLRLAKSANISLFGTPLLWIHNLLDSKGLKLSCLNGLKQEHFDFFIERTLTLIQFFKNAQGLDIQAMNLLSKEQLGCILGNFIFMPLFQDIDGSYDWAAISKLSPNKISTAIAYQVYFRGWFNNSADAILQFLQECSEEKLSWICHFRSEINFLTKEEEFTYEEFAKMSIEELGVKITNFLRSK